MVPWLTGFPGELDRDHSFLVLLLCYTVPSDANTLPPKPPLGILFVTTELFITLKKESADYLNVQQQVIRQLKCVYSMAGSVGTGKAWAAL